MTDKISRNLDILEKSVSECGKSAIEDAAIAGKDLDSMSTEELNRFRKITGKYKNECICMKTITREQAEKKGKEVSESIQRFAKVATEKGKEKYEEITAKAIPKIEEMKEKSRTEYGIISTKATQLVKEMQERAKKLSSESTSS